MKYPKEYLDEIKLRLKVSQVVGKFVKLKKRGKEFIGLSPFSNEKTPSFTVNDEKGFYHCFSSAEHGNIFDFLMKTKNYKFGEAVKDVEIVKVLRKMRKQRQDSIELYKKGERPELLEVELAEIKIIDSFLPKQLSDEETKKICKEVIESLGASSIKDMGKIMGSLKQKYSDSIDFSKANIIVKGLLS